jgi:hypothetical protein
MNLRQIALEDAWASRRLLIGLRDATSFRDTCAC